MPGPRGYARGWRYVGGPGLPSPGTENAPKITAGSRIADQLRRQRAIQRTAKAGELANNPSLGAVRPDESSDVLILNHYRAGPLDADGRPLDRDGVPLDRSVWSVDSVNGQPLHWNDPADLELAGQLWRKRISITKLVDLSVPPRGGRKLDLSQEPDGSWRASDRDAGLVIGILPPITSQRIQED